MESQIIPLPNGATFIFIHKPDAPMFAVKTVMRTGHSDWAERRMGLAHFTEHMLFEGSAALAPGTLSREYEKRYFQPTNAVTMLDETEIFLDADEGVAYRFMADELLSGYMPILYNAFAMEFRPAVVDQERQRIVSEIQGIIDQQDLYGAKAKAHRAWLGAHRPHILSQNITVIGTVENARETTANELADFYAANYCGKRLVITCAGPYLPEQLLDALGELTENIIPGQLPDKEAFEFREVEGHYSAPEGSAGSKMNITLSLPTWRQGHEPARHHARSRAAAYLREFWRQQIHVEKSGYAASINLTALRQVGEADISYSYRDRAHGLDLWQRFVENAQAATHVLDQDVFNDIYIKPIRMWERIEPKTNHLAGMAHQHYLGFGNVWTSRRDIDGFTQVTPADVQREIAEILNAPVAVFSWAAKDAVLGLDDIKAALPKPSGSPALGVDPADVPVRPAVEHVVAPGALVPKQ